MSSITHVHPAKAVGRIEMPFVRNTHVVPSNTLLDKCPDPVIPTKRGRFGCRHTQVTAIQLLWPAKCAKLLPTSFLKYALFKNYFKVGCSVAATAVCELGGVAKTFSGGKVSFFTVCRGQGAKREGHV